LLSINAIAIGNKICNEICNEINANAIDAAIEIVSKLTIDREQQVANWQNAAALHRDWITARGDDRALRTMTAFTTLQSSRHAAATCQVDHGLL
jgi:hypothetical protein